MSSDVVIYFILLLILVLIAGFYYRRKRSQSGPSFIVLNNRRISSADLRRFPEAEIKDLVILIFQSKGFQVQETPSDLQATADYLLEKEGRRGFVSTRHWRAEKVGVEQISQELSEMNQHNSSQNYIVTTGVFHTEAHEMAKFNRNLFLIDGGALKKMIAGMKKMA